MRNTKASLVAGSGAKEKKASRIFKPLVASSLALALGVSVGNATCTPSSSPIFCSSSDTEIQITNANGFSWGTSSDNNYYTFNVNSSPQNDAMIWAGKYTSGDIQYVDGRLAVGATQSSSMKSNKGLLMGSGTGTLNINLYSGDQNNKTFTLDLSNISPTTNDTSYYAIKGNLAIMNTNASNYTRSNTFNAQLGGNGISGLLTFSSIGKSNLEFTGNSASVGGGIVSSAGTSNITATNLTIARSDADALKVITSGILNITATNLKLIRNSSDTSATTLWGAGTTQINITLNDNGNLSVYRQNESTLGKVALDSNTQFALTLKGSALIKANFTLANNSRNNTRTFNFGDTSSSGAKTATLQGNFSSGKGTNNAGIASIFNFQANDFTFLFQNANGVTQGMTFDNARNNQINFNANNGVFDLNTNALTISGTLGINLGTANNSGGARTATTNTINSGSIASSGTTTITFNADNSTLNLKYDKSGIINVSGGTTGINFNGVDGILAGAVSTSAGTTTISIADDKSGTINGAVETSGSGTTNVVFANTTNTNTLNLKGLNNTITSITSGTGNSTFTLDTAQNSVSAIVTNAISGADNLTIALSGTTEPDGTSKVASLTLNNTNGDSTINALSLTNTSSARENMLNLSANKTTITGNLSIDSDKGLTINLADTTELASGIANSGNVIVNFNGTSETLTGAINTEGSGITTFNLGANNSSIATATISGAITNATTNIFNVNATTTTFKNDNGLVFSGGTNTINFANTNGATLNWQDNGGVTQAISTTGGNTQINFNQDGVVAGAVSTSGSGATTTIKIADGKSGAINEAVTTGNSGTTNISFAGGNDTKTLTLNANNNTLSSITFDSTSINNVIALNNAQGTTTFSGAISVGSNNGITFDLNGTTSTTLTFGDSGGLTNAGATTINFNKNGGILNTGTAGITTALTGTTTFNLGADTSDTATTEFIATITGALTNNATATDKGQIFNVKAKNTTLQYSATAGGDNTGLAFGAGNNIINFENTSNGGATLNWKNNPASGASANTQSISTTGGNTQINFNQDGVVAGAVSTNGGTTAIKIADGKSGTINGAVSTTGGVTNAVFADTAGTNALNLKGDNNTITSITSSGTGNSTFKLDTTSNAVSVGVTNAISGSNLTITLGGNASNKAELTLSNANNSDSTIKSLSLSETSSDVGNNVLNLQARKTSITNGIAIGATQGLTINLANAELASNITNQGIGAINFNGTTSSKLTGDISTSGSSNTTTLNVDTGTKGFVNGNIELSGGGANKVTIGENGTLTLQGTTNQLTNVASTTSGILSLDGASNANGVTASVASAIENSTTTLNFNGASSKKAEMTLSSGGNKLKAITLGDGNGSATADNKLILSAGTTTIDTDTSIANGQDLTFDLKDSVNLTNNISNAGTANLEFNGTNGILAGTLTTTAGTTTIKIADGKSGTITGAVKTTDGATNINFASGSNKSLKLQGSNNAITTITSDGSENTLMLDTTRNGVSTEVSSAISGANNLTIALSGKTDKIASLTLNNSGGNSTIKALTFGSGAKNNIINLSQNNTGITDYVSLASGQGATFNLNSDSSLTFAKNITNTSSLESLVFNIKGTNTISGDITTGDGTSIDGITRLNVETSSTGVITGNIFTNNSNNNNNVTNITIDNGGTLTLQGATNQLTNVASTTSGILSLDGASNANGVIASVANAITDNSTTLNFNGASGKKAEMTLSVGNNALKAITLGDGNGSATADNKLILSTGTTTIGTNTDIVAGQALTFDLANGSNVNLTNNISNAGTTNLEFNGTNGTLTGTLTTTAGTTTIKIADGKSGTITGAVKTTDGATNIDFASGNGAKTLTLSGDNNSLSGITFGTDSIDNIITLNNVAGTTSFASAIHVGANNGIAFDLNGTTSTTLTFGDSGGLTNANTTTINFNENGGTLNAGTAGITTALTGITTFNLGADITDTTATDFATTITGALTNNGRNVFNVNAKTINLKYGNGLEFSSGTNIINFENTSSGGATLNWQDSDGNAQTISTTGGNTQINFNQSGILNGAVSTDGTSATTTIKIADGKSGTITGAVKTTDGATNINFASGSDAKSLTLGESGNTITNITFGSGTSTNNSIALSQGKTTLTNALSVTSNQEISFNLGSNTNIEFADSLTNSGGDAKILNTSDSNPANITLKSLSISGNGTNTIGKSTIASGDNFDTKISKAFVGTLKIAEGISSSAGSNDIFFSATNTQNSTVIAPNANKVAINTTGGTNNIYLNVDASTIQAGTTAIKTYLGSLASANGDTQKISEAYTALASQAIISGNITANNGSINLKIIGSPNTLTSTGRSITREAGEDKAQIGILGNIQNDGGNINIILKDTIFAPSQLLMADKAINVGGSNAGNITTAAGTTTMVTRFTNASPTPTGASIYNIKNSGNGNTNIILQGNVDVGANVKYASGGAVNLIFANSYTESTTDFSTPTISGGEAKAFGTTYLDGIRLTLQDRDVNTSGNTQKSFLSLAGVSEENYAFSFQTSRKSEGGIDTDVVTLKGVAVGEIVSLDPKEGSNTSYSFDITLDEKAIYLGNIALSKSTQAVNLTMNQGSKLFTDNEILAVTNLAISDTELDRDNLFKNSFVQNSTIIDLATDGNDFGSIAKREEFRVILIGGIPTTNGNDPVNISTKTNTGLTGNNALFRVYVNPDATNGVLGNGQNNLNNATPTYAYSDRVLITNGTEGKHYIQAIYNSDIDISHISYKEGGTETEGNIAVATVANGTNITFEGIQQIQGFDLVGTTLTTNDDTGIDGNSSGTGYTTYFIESVSSTGASPVNTEVTTSALGLNYELFLANFNSLNKRMGELRNNDNGQGAWGRIFNGMLNTSYGLETTSMYTTIQAGYDYAFGFEGANNYLGIALSYANSMSKSSKKLDIDGSEKGLNDSTTHGVEVALYNSYVEDNGWFNDTIMKFSYMISDLSILGQDTTYNSNNYGLVFSDEFGYRFKLGSEKEWYIDPQLEVGFGYFNQSNLKQVLGESSLDGIQDAIMTLRARAGANWAYDFKRFTQGKGINASVYVGTYYSYDYINGGEISLTTNLGKNTSLTPLASTGRFELNVGTNIEIKDNTRIYFDFERSFGGTITTEYQVNVGVRYSFGENTGYKPIAEEVEFKAPLKVEGEESKEGDKEAKEGEEKQGDDKVKEEEKKEESKTTKALDKTQPKEKSSK